MGRRPRTHHPPPRTNVSGAVRRGVPLRVDLAPHRGRIVRGVRAALGLVVRNVSGQAAVGVPPVAIVLRGVEWAHTTHDERSWIHRVYGDTHMQADQNVVLDRDAHRLSSVMFETVVLFPGEQATVVMPLTPQHLGPQDVDITYATIPQARWMHDIWFADDADPSAPPERFVLLRAATVERIRGRKQVTVPTLLRESSGVENAPLMLKTAVWSVKVPVLADPKGTLTGGMPYDAALARMNWGEWLHARPPRRVWGYWRAVLGWVFVREDEDAVALCRRRGHWQREVLPHMDPTVPERFGSGPSGTTPMILPAAIFGDLLPVRAPSEHPWYDVGMTAVPRDRLWAVLKRAEDRRIVVRLVTYDANGLGNEQAIAAGIDVDQSGRWMNPQM